MTESEIAFDVEPLVVRPAVSKGPCHANEEIPVNLPVRFAVGENACYPAHLWGVSKFRAKRPSGRRDRFSRSQALDGREGCPSGAINLVPRDWPGATFAASREESLQLLAVAFVPVRSDCPAAVRLPKLSSGPRIDHGRAPPSKDLDTLRRKRPIAARLVRDVGYAAVGVADGDGQPSSQV